MMQQIVDGLHGAKIEGLAQTYSTQIGDAKALLDAGTINQGEFDRLTEKALA